MTQASKVKEVEEELPHEAPLKRSQHRNRKRIMSITSLHRITIDPSHKILSPKNTNLLIIYNNLSLQTQAKSSHIGHWGHSCESIQGHLHK